MGLNVVLLVSFFEILASLTFETVAVNQGCDYSQYLSSGTQYYIYNKEYPYFYGTGTDCLWTGQSPSDTKINITCDINLPRTLNCNGDRLKISLSGNPNLVDSINYCGTGSVSLISNANYIAVGLVGNSGGNFICTLTAVQNPKPTSTPCDCGWKKATRIVGGAPTLVNEYPAMAGIIDASSKQLICGATIISSRFVMSAAHCMRLITDKQYMGVLTGDFDLSSGSDTTAAALYLVEGYWEHPGFNPDTRLNDLAIVKTIKEIAFSLYVGPICLPFLNTYDTFVSQNVTILGWGQEFFNGPESDVLQKVNVQVVSNSYCQSQYSDDIISSGQICTWAKGKDACQRDSGGPVLWQDPTTMKLKLIGVISYGFACATPKPAVNTRITSYLPWIVQITNGANFCVK